jgi:hypothetical protein
MAQQGHFGYVALSRFRDPSSTRKWPQPAIGLSGFEPCNP